MNADSNTVALLNPDGSDGLGGVVPSPCTGICRIGSREHCLGCGRKLDEIAGWSAASTQRRLTIRAQAAERLRLYPELGA